MKVILTTAPRAEGDLERGGLPFLGIGYIGSWLEKYGYEIKITDPHTFGWNSSKSVDEILKYKPDVVGVTATTNNRFKAIELIKELKKNKPDLFIFVGGPHFALTAKNALKVVPEIDVVVKGEGEITSKELLEEFSAYGRSPVGRQKNKDFEKVKGIFYRNSNREIIETPDRPFEHDIDKFKLNWDLFDIEKYNRNIDGTNIRAIGVISSRGCPNRCAYCVNAAFRNQSFFCRNPIEFVDEVEFLKKKHGFKGFDFWDDTFTIYKEHVKQICDEIIKRKLNIKWYARARVNTVDKKILSLMKKAGCIRISYGVESGSPRILKKILKDITPEQVLEAVKISSDLDMKVVTNFMVNLPDEKPKDLKMTIDLMKKLNAIKNLTAAYGFSIIYPGTQMEIWAKEEGVLPKDFSWNEPYKSKKYKIAGLDSSLPYMEWKGAEIEKIKDLMTKELGIKGGVLKKGFKKLKKVKSFKEFRGLLKAGIKYIKR